MFICMYLCFFFFFKQKTAYEMRISDWSSDVCSSDLNNLCPVTRPANLTDCYKMRRWCGQWGEHSRCLPRCLRVKALSRRARLQTCWVSMRSPQEIGRASCRERVCPYV